MPFTTSLPFSFSPPARPVPMLFSPAPYFVKQRFFKRFRGVDSCAFPDHHQCLERPRLGTSNRCSKSNTTVYRVSSLRQHGEASLWDGRQDNGTEKLSEHFLHLSTRSSSNPQEHGWRRPTWTRETLVETIVRGAGPSSGDHESGLGVTVPAGHRAARGPSTRDQRSTLCATRGPRAPLQQMPPNPNASMANPWAFRRAATALVAQALLWAAPEDARARTAVQRGLAYVLKALDHPTMKAIPPGRKVEGLERFDYTHSVWAYPYALELLCHVRARKAGGEQTQQVEASIPRLVKTIIEAEMPKGGWNYTPFVGVGPLSPVTAPVAQALLLARSQRRKDSRCDFCTHAPSPGSLSQAGRPFFLYQPSGR